MSFCALSIPHGRETFCWNLYAKKCFSCGFWRDSGRLRCLGSFPPDFPLWERLPLWKRIRRPGSVQPTAVSLSVPSFLPAPPERVATQNWSMHCHIRIAFQSASPTRAMTGIHRKERRLPMVSIHATLAGNDLFYSVAELVNRISIRATHEGGGR